VIKILITGASGFIAGHFIRRFSGYDGLQLHASGRRAAQHLPATVTWHVADLTSRLDIACQPDVVIHAAGRAVPWGSAHQYQQENVVTTRQVIDFCERRGRPRLIFLSSPAVCYRYHHQLDLSEHSPCGPSFVNRYAASKYAAEQLVSHYRGDKTILRPCAVFGEGDTLLLPPLVRAARKKQLPLLLPDGMAAQGELMAVEVLCDYLLQAARSPQLQPVYNISNDRPVEIAAFLQQLLQQLQLPAPARRIKTRTAMRAARWLERLWPLVPTRQPPPVTEFGVGVFAYSKTLNVSRMLRDFGPPSMTLEQGITQLISRGVPC
jgi:nucleoside-diphosphate-sugar epimerase